MKKIELAYLAGVIDSDGHIGIKKNTYQVRVIKDSSQPTYSERVGFKQVESQAVNLAHKLFEGYRYVTDPSAKRGKPLQGWQVTDIKAATFLRAILPYLRIKRLQAKACLKLREVKEKSKKARVAFGRGHVGSATRPAKFGRQMEALKQEIHRLNHTGI